MSRGARGALEEPEEQRSRGAEEQRRQRSRGAEDTRPLSQATPPVRFSLSPLLQRDRDRNCRSICHPERGRPTAESKDLRLTGLCGPSHRSFDYAPGRAPLRMTSGGDFRVQEISVIDGSPFLLFSLSPFQERYPQQPFDIDSDSDSDSDCYSVPQPSGSGIQHPVSSKMPRCGRASFIGRGLGRKQSG